MYDLYRSNQDDSVRFILGKKGEKKLFVVGLNPSTANKEKSDVTVAKVEKVAKQNGFDGFVMVNLYPLRAKNPNKLPTEANKNLLIENIKVIKEIAMASPSPIFWAAWGENILIRTYLFRALELLVKEIEELKGLWLHYGKLTIDGHPRHPSRLAYSWMFSEFNVLSYISQKTRKTNS